MIPVAAWIYYSSTIRLPHIWSAFLASSVAILVLMVWRYRQGRWRRQL